MRPPPPPRTGWWACPRGAASPWAAPWWRAGSACRARPRGRLPCEHASCPRLLRLQIDGPLGSGQLEPVAIESFLDPPPEVGLRVRPAGGHHLDREPQSHLRLAKADDALGERSIEPQTRLGRPVAADALQGLEGASHVGIVGDADIHDGARPAPIVVGELRQIPVGHDALGAVEKAQPGDAKPDRLDHARVPTHIDHIPYLNRALKGKKKPRKNALVELLAAKPNANPGNTARAARAGDILATFLNHAKAHPE